jgi:hypothetical protein
VITSRSDLTTEEICAQVKQFGYAASQKIRIYGEEFEALSDPFPSADGIAMHVRSTRTSIIRVLHLPATITHRARHRLPRAA